ncbi:helix-turn-helix transcriptional regulator [Intrasporangium sp.]|uniref:helix-turn-helix transcriptional regulator n=1 Tax=Intrasporangium sp. TaxID=1925024 RepID=UPI00293ABB32|nr:helix-turn-helix transcriptional regulator [Intrasporangium sp.]MDV3220301.1 helix-turn-helix transcriptional regulator [Intrasporangium sp.]
MSPSSITSTIHQVAFTATDPVEIERICAEELDAPLRLVDGPDGYYFSVTRTEAGRFSFVDLSGSGLSAELAPTGPADARGSALFVTGERGLLSYETSDVREQIGPGESACVVPAAEASRVDWTGDEPRARCVRVDLALLRDVASATTGVTDVVFTGSRPVSRAAERHWQETVEHVARTLIGGPGSSVTPLVVGESARFLAAVALSTFPNTTMEPAAPARDLPLTAETVRDAVTFVEERADTDLTVADIAAAAGVTPRAIQLAFRRHLDTTPMAYLRRVRLARVHEELELAGPDDGVTVTEVASKWGFSGSSRFTSYYRDAFGEAPSQTLAS